MLSPTFRSSPSSNSNNMVTEDETILSPAQELRKIQSRMPHSPADSHRSDFSNRTQTGPQENDIEDADVYVNGLRIDGRERSALGARALSRADPELNLRADQDEVERVLESPLEVLLNWLSAMGCTPATLEQVLKLEVDSETLVTLARLNDQPTMENELLIDSGLTRAKIIGKIHEIDSSKSALSKEEKSRPATVSSYKSRELLPPIPSGSADGRLLPTVTKWKQYMVAIEGYLQLVGALELAELCKTLFKTPTLFKRHHLQIKLRTTADKEADLKWANEVLVKATPTIQRHLSREENITWHQQRSGAMMIASLSLMIMNRTQEQDTEALARFMSWPSVPKAELLQKGIIDMDDEMERLNDGGFEINSQIEEHVLTRLTKTIRGQERHKFDIAMFWAQIPRSLCHTNKVIKMRGIIQQCIADYPELKSNTAQIHAALARKVKDWVCFGHREYGICNKQARGHKCNFLHLTPRPTTVCTNAAYVAGNECSNFNKCQHLHPKSKRTLAADPANKPKSATGAMMSESLALNRPTRSNFGQDNREHYLDTTEYDDLIIADVPANELEAALREPVNSQSSETESVGSMDQTISDIEADILEHDAWGCADADYEPSHPSCESTPKQFSSCEDDFENLFDDLDINDQPTPVTHAHLGRTHRTYDELLADSGLHTPSSVDFQSKLSAPLTQELTDCGSLGEESRMHLPASQNAEESPCPSESEIHALSYFGIDEDELIGVPIYTPPATQESDLDRDERETSKAIIEPRELFPAEATVAACDVNASEHNGQPPSTFVIVDSGSTRHMVGQSGLPFAHNLRQSNGTVVTGINGCSAMDVECDLMLRNGTILEDCLVNGDSELNICSERNARSKSHSWQIRPLGSELKQIETPKGLVATCYSFGGLDYLPYELEPVAWRSGPPEEVADDFIYAGCITDKVFDQRQHELAGHYPRVRGCDVCARAFMQSLGAKRGGLQDSANKHLATLNIDLIDWGRADNNNCRYSLTGVITDTAFPTIRQLVGKSGAEASKAIRSMVAEIERISFSSTTKQYKVERIRKGQGSEFKAAHLDDCAKDNILSTTGEEGRHTDCAVVEGFNKTVEHTATALALTALSNPDHAIDLHGELSRQATKLIRLRSRTDFQKETGISAWREQTLSDPDSTEVQLRWGSLTYGFIKKEDRGHKLEQRAYAAIFVGTDDTIIGAVRLVPFIVSPDGSIKLFKTKVTKTYQSFDGVYPLNFNTQCVYPECAAEWMLGDELLDIEVAEAPTKEELSQGYEVEKIVGKNLYDPETGDCEYHCAFKGYSADHNRWIDKTEMCCDELIADYEAEQSHQEVIAGCCAEAAFDVMPQTCSCGGNCADCLAYVKGDDLYLEVDQREVQLAQVQEDFDAKIAFAYLHECSPLEVSTEMIRTTNGGVEAYEDLYLKINLEYDADGSDFTWVERVLAQEAPAPKIDFVAGAIGKNSVSDFVAGAIVKNPVSDDVPEDDDGTDDDMPELEKIDFVAGAIGKDSVSDFVAGAIVKTSVGNDNSGDDSDIALFEFEANEIEKIDGTDKELDAAVALVALSALPTLPEMPEPNLEIPRDAQNEILTRKLVMERADAMMCAAEAYRADCEKAATPAEMANVTEKMVTVTKGLARCGPPVQTEFKPTVSNDGAKRGEVSNKEASSRRHQGGICKIQGSN